MIVSKRIKIIVKNDLLAWFRNGKITLVLLSFFFILGIALLFAYNDYKNTSKNVSYFQEKLRNHWVNQNEKHPHGAAHIGTFSIKEVTPFSIIDKGLYPYVGQLIKIETHKQNAAEIRQAEDVTYLSRQGELTVSFILQVFIPLFIIFFSYNSITKEKEQETIKLGICQGINKKEIIISKFFSSFIVLSIIIIPFFILSGILLGISSNSDYFISTLFLFFGAYLIYFIIFICLSIGVSARCSTSRQALVWLFSIWVITVILVPKLSTLFSEKLNPTQSSYDFTEEIEDKYFSSSYKSVSKTSKLKEKVKKDLLEEYGVSSLDSIPFNFFGYFLQFTESKGTKIYNESHGKIDRIFNDQNKIHNSIAFLSPLVNIRFISMAIASSNIQEQISFINFSEKYRQNMMSILNNDIMENAGKNRYLGDEKLWEKVPKYIYPKRTLYQKLNDCKASLFILLAWLSISFLFLKSSIKHINE